jgi:hypothetical protein
MSDEVSETRETTNGVDETTNGVVTNLRPSTVPDPSGRRGPFDLQAQQKKVLLAALVLHLILTRFTLRDLRRRPAVAVRGPKRLWRVWAALNTSGSLAYWLVGRRRGVAVPLEPTA